jgi:predicted amidophosphoribosyltransferase
MAQVQCRECGRHYSGRRAACDVCGAPVSAALTPGELEELSPSTAKRAPPVAPTVQSKVLAACPDCGRGVSPRAEACPGCGAPLASSSTALGSHVVIERTGRRWKRMRVNGVVLVFVGVILCATPLAPLGIFLVFVAMVLFLWSRVGAWWTNG